jgi:2-haloacid dehalogenase
MPKYSVLLFDADATLLDFHRSETEAVRECLDFFGLPSDDSVIAEYSRINAGYWKMLERGEIEKEKLYPARWQSLIDHYGFACNANAISDEYIRRLTTKSYLLDGALELCQRLHGKFKMYIVTNGQKDVQKGRLFPSPIFKYFDRCFISEDIGYEKPSVKFFDKVIEQIPDYDPARAIIIGDSLTSDMQGGLNIGIDTCWFNPHGKAKPDNMELTYVATDLSEIGDILLQ